MSIQNRDVQAILCKMLRELRRKLSALEREDSKARGMQTHGIQDVLAKMLRVLRGKLRALEHIKPRMPEACRIEAFRQSGQDAERTG